MIKIGCFSALAFLALLMVIAINADPQPEQQEPAPPEAAEKTDADWEREAQEVAVGYVTEHLENGIGDDRVNGLATWGKHSDPEKYGRFYRFGGKTIEDKQWRSFVLFRDNRWECVYLNVRGQEIVNTMADRLERIDDQSDEDQ